MTSTTPLPLNLPHRRAGASSARGSINAVLVFLRGIMATVALPCLLAGGYAGNANAQAPHPCTSINPSGTDGCSKEIRVYNNLGNDPTTGKPRMMYVVWQ